jgi:hypothetical protein
LPQFAIRWNAGVNNWMTYLTGDIPVGAYNSTRLANLGIGHGAVDAGERWAAPVARYTCSSDRDVLGWTDKPIL